MRTIKELHTKLFQLQLLLRQTLLTSKQKQDVLSKINSITAKLQNNNNEVDYNLDNNIIEQRRNILKSNEGLKDIFKTFWFTCRNICESEYLSKEAYIKIFTAIQHGLLGYNQDDDTFQLVEIDYNNDIQQFGAIDEIRFYDILFNYFDCWCNFIDSNYITVFAWSLLDAVCDVRYQPPKLRPIREIKRFTRIPNEASMYESYLKNKNYISKCVIQEESLSQVAIVQRKLLTRKTRASFSGNKMLMLEALTNTYQNLNKNSELEEGEYSDSSSEGDNELREQQINTQNESNNSNIVNGDNGNIVNGNIVDGIQGVSVQSSPKNSKIKGKRIVLPFARYSIENKRYMEPLGIILIYNNYLY